MANYFRNENFEISKAQKMEEININRKILKVIILVQKLQGESLYQISMNVVLVCVIF